MAWYDDARFNCFAACEVFVEDDGFLYVENQAFDYSGNYVCRKVLMYQGEVSVIYDATGASNGYIESLTKAPLEQAKAVIAASLGSWAGPADEESYELIMDCVDQVKNLTEDDIPFTYY